MADVEDFLTPREIAQSLEVSVDTVTRIFQDYPRSLFWVQKNRASKPPFESSFREGPLLAMTTKRFHVFTIDMFHHLQQRSSSLSRLFKRH